MEASANISALKEHGIQFWKLLTLGSDGPNVNKTIWRELESKIKETELGFGNLVDVWTCNIHVMHNGFSKGLVEYDHEIEQFTIDLFSVLKYSAGRRVEYRNLQLSLDVEVMMPRFVNVQGMATGEAEAVYFLLNYTFYVP